MTSRNSGKCELLVTCLSINNLLLECSLPWNLFIISFSILSYTQVSQKQTWSEARLEQGDSGVVQRGGREEKFERMWLLGWPSYWWDENWGKQFKPLCKTEQFIFGLSRFVCKVSDSMNAGINLDKASLRFLLDYHNRFWGHPSPFFFIYYFLWNEAWFQKSAFRLMCVTTIIRCCDIK